MIRFSCKIFTPLLAALLTLTSGSALAQTYFQESNKTVYKLGVQETYFYVTFTEGFGRTCAHNLAYISADYKGIYAMLLAAKLSGKKISRVDYQQLNGLGSECQIKLVEVAN